jgi:DNA-binding transcriptional LysR family regulator
MIDLELAEIFVSIAETGSLAAAGRRICVSPSMISRRISKLEADLKVQLLNRTTRHLGLTEAGQDLLEWAQDALSQRHQLIDRMQAKHSACEGNVRLAIDGLIAASYLPDVLQQFYELYPKITVSVITCENPPAYLDGRSDLAVHAGPTPSGSLFGQQAYEYGRCLVAAPSYIEKHGTPSTPADLLRHRCIFMSSSRRPEWSFKAPDGEVVPVKLHPYVETNSYFLLRNLVVDGLGIASLGRPLAEVEMREGHMAPVLETYECLAPEGSKLGFWIVYAEKRRTLRVRVFSEFLVRYFRNTVIVSEVDEPSIEVRSFEAGT